MSTSFDCAAEFYDRTRGPPPLAMLQLVRTLVDELKRHARVLDVGAGTGRFAKPFQDAGVDTVGVDIAERMLEKAVAKGVRNLLKADVCFLPFRDNAFDAALCVHLLHLISDWKGALQEICRVTREVMLTITYTAKSPVLQAYSQILKGYGYESERPGKSEWELKDIVHPLKSVFACSFDSSADELIGHLSMRAYSGQWQIPEDVNADAIRELTRQFSGQVFPAELRVLTWRIADLTVRKK